MRRDRIIKLSAACTSVAAAVVIDRMTKRIVASNMALGEQRDFIPGILRWSYIHNKGAAFGSFADARWIFMTASVILIAAIAVYMCRAKRLTWFSVFTLSSVLGGGIGNMIDRVKYGYVIDFIDFYPIPFWKWIFNMADAFVCVGGILFAVALLLDDRKSKTDKVKVQNTNEQ